MQVGSSEVMLRKALPFEYFRMVKSREAEHASRRTAVLSLSSTDFISNKLPNRYQNPSRQHSPPPDAALTLGNFLVLGPRASDAQRRGAASSDTTADPLIMAIKFLQSSIHLLINQIHYNPAQALIRQYQFCLYVRSYVPALLPRI